MILLLFLLLSLSFSAQAEIYLWLDAEGNQHFSDKPQRNAQVFQVHAGYTYYEVSKVYDGDTILLANGKRLRLSGINTPEVEGRYKSAQAGGEAAKRWLIKKLKNSKVRLEVDVERKDKYDRLLAHLFTEEQEHINLELVENGLASVNIYPPNLKYTAALLAAQRAAEYGKKGIWKDKAYAPKAVEQIRTGSYNGWQRVLGSIKHFRHERKYSYLDLTAYFSLKMSKKSLSLFPALASYTGKKVEVRGWVSKHKQSYSMFIRHPSAIIRLE
jgi:micrococcal nuclease